MIVLDEQLDDPQIAREIRRWHRAVLNIRDLRPTGDVDDDTIPALLRRERGCVFVTNDHDDFWRKIEASPRYAVVCFQLPARRTREIPSLLRRLFRLAPFQTERGRCGKIIRLTQTGGEYYSRLSDPAVEFQWPPDR